MKKVKTESFNNQKNVSFAILGTCCIGQKCKFYTVLESLEDTASVTDIRTD